MISLRVRVEIDKTVENDTHLLYRETNLFKRSDFLSLGKFILSYPNELQSVRSMSFNFSSKYMPPATSENFRRDNY